MQPAMHARPWHRCSLLCMRTPPRTHRSVPHGCRWIQSLCSIVSRVAGIRAGGRRGRLHARSCLYVEASVHAAGCTHAREWVAGSANAEHAEGGGRQPPTQSTQSTLASIHVHKLMIASVHARTKSRSMSVARVPTSSPPAI